VWSLIRCLHLLLYALFCVLPRLLPTIGRAGRCVILWLRRVLAYILFLFVIILSVEAGTWISFSGQPEGRPKAEVLEHSDSRTVVEITVPGMEEEKTVLDGREFSVLSFPYEMDFTGTEGRPQLPVIEKWIAVPDDKDVNLRIVSYECDTLEGYVPVPYQDRFLHEEFTIDERFYSQGPTYPDEPAVISEPGIMRDYRYVILTFQPVQYNPAKQEMYVYSDIEVELIYSGLSETNVLERTRPYTSHAFEPIYRHKFINYSFVKSPNSGRETYLVIVPDAWAATVQPLADWRTQKGQKAKVVVFSDIGIPMSIDLMKNYLDNAYRNWDIPPDYCLIIGDTTQLHFFLTNRGMSTDVMVGVWPAATQAELSDLVDNTLNYEKDPYVADPTWYRKACFVGFSVYNAAVDRLVDYGFTRVDSPVPGDHHEADSASAWTNDGRFFVGSFGHGGWHYNDDPWDSFTKADASNLTNGEMRPFVVSGGCQSANWRVPSYPWKGWVKKQIGYTGSHMNIDFVQVNDGLESIYAYCDSVYNLGQVMYSAVGTGACVDICDPALTLWGGAPTTSMNCTYDSEMPAGASNFAVSVEAGGNPVEGATVCLMSATDVYVVGETDASGNVTLNPIPKSDNTVRITITSPFHPFHEGTIAVNHATPFPGYHSRTLSEIAGNGNGRLNPGETFNMDVTLKNYGTAASNGVSAILRCDAPTVTLTDSTANYGNIGAGAMSAPQTFAFQIAQIHQQNATYLHFTVEVTDASKKTWEYPVSTEVVAAPNILPRDIPYWAGGKITEFTVGGTAEPGDTFTLWLTLLNDSTHGSGDSASAATAYLYTDDPFVSFVKDNASFGAISVGCSADNLGDKFEIATHPTTPEGHRITELKIGNISSSGYVNWQSTADPVYFRWYSVGGDSLVVGTKPEPSDTLFFDDFEHPAAPGTFDPAKWDVPNISAEWSIINEAVAHGTYCAKLDTLPSPGDYMLPTLPYGDIKGISTINWSCWLTNTYPAGSVREFLDADTGNAEWKQAYMGGVLGMPALRRDTLGYYEPMGGVTCLTAYDSTRFRFRITSGFGSADGVLYLDDFLVLGRVDIEPPAIRNVTKWTDTLFTGPFPVSSEITSDWHLGGAVAAETLYYRAGGNWTGLGMSSAEPDIYEAAIPIQVQGTTVDYYVWATDDAGVPNAVTDPVAAPTDGFYSFLVKGIGTSEKEIPRVYRLCQNHPNPFIGRTVIRYALPMKSRVSLRIYDLSGRIVKRVIDRQQKPGFYMARWDARDSSGRKVSAGVYFCKLSAGDFTATKKLTLF
jgi:hypothetical protein